MLEDFEALSKYKKSLMGKYKDKKWLSQETVKSNLSKVKSYYEFIIGNPNNLEILRNINEERLSLAYFTSYEIVIAYLENYKNIAGIHSQSSVGFLGFVTSLLDPDYGWIAQNPYYVNDLPDNIKPLNIDTGSWK